MYAYELIDSPDKWCQNQFYTPDGRMCALWAIHTVYGHDWTLESEMERKLRQSTPDGSIALWQDNSTWEEVYSMMKRLGI
jgi:hypothetical protein